MDLTLPSLSLALVAILALPVQISAAPVLPHPGACTSNSLCPVVADAPAPTPTSFSFNKFTTIIPDSITGSVPLVTQWPDQQSVMGFYGLSYAQEHDINLEASSLGAAPLLELAVSYIAEKSLWHQIGGQVVVRPATHHSVTSTTKRISSMISPTGGAVVATAGPVQTTAKPAPAAVSPTSISLWRPTGTVSTITFFNDMLS